MEHELSETETGVTCQVCRQSWRRKPVSPCPGVPRYEWGQAPENLLTENQLAKRRLNPGPTRGVVGTWFLYDLAEATPFSAAQLEQIRQKRREGRERLKRRLEREERAREAFRVEQARLRDSAITWARELLAQGTAVILDTETTGLDGEAEVVEVVVINLEGKPLFETLVKPRGEISEEAIAIHGIIPEKVANASGFEEVLGGLQECLAGRPVICYNQAFDERMLAQSARRAGFLASDIFFADSACAMERYADFVGEWSARYGRNKWQPLPGGNHTALGDCLATLAVIMQMAAEKLPGE